MKFGSTSQRSLLLLLLLPVLCHEVAANTEIINFSSSREQTLDLPIDVVGNCSTLHPSDNERRCTLEPAALHTPLHQVCERDYAASGCAHELWFFLDLDDEKWASYSTFTLRLSWSASTPAEFTMAFFTPRDLLDRLSFSDRDLISTTLAGSTSGAHVSSSRRTPTTRSRYARIRAVHAGIPTPSFRSHLAQPVSPLSLLMPLVPQPQPQVEVEADTLPRVPNPVPIGHPGSPTDHNTPATTHLAVQCQERGTGNGNVSFIVILEPLRLGVLPATILPTVCLLIPIVLAAALVVPYAYAYLEPYAQQARDDMKSKARAGLKDR